MLQSIQFENEVLEFYPCNLGLTQLMILRLINLTHGFYSDKNILNSISLSMDKAKIYAVVGPNGSGKTSLFNIISGFLKPQAGSIFLNSLRIDGLPPYKINYLGISRTFQDLRTITALTVKENVILAIQNNPTDNWIAALLPPRLHHETYLQLEAKANLIIDQFFLREVKDSLVDEISYGQQKLLTLSCCVANGSSLLLLDEPVSGIQPEYRYKIAALLKELKQSGKTIFLIEHNIAFIADVADHIFFLHDGKVSSFDDIAQMETDSGVIDAYI